jgi:hypothetical protein
MHRLPPAPLTEIQTKIWKKMVDRVEGYESLMREEIIEIAISCYRLDHMNEVIHRTIQTFENNSFIISVDNNKKEYFIMKERPYLKSINGRITKDRGERKMEHCPTVSRTGFQGLDLYSANMAGRTFRRPKKY